MRFYSRCRSTKSQVSYAAAVDEDVDEAQADADAAADQDRRSNVIRSALVS